MNNKKNIVITGGNRGIGLGLVENLSSMHNVIFTSRDRVVAEEIVNKAKNHNIEINYVLMDVNDSQSIAKASEEISQKFKSVDLLFNNAGILLNEYQLPALDTSEKSILETFNTNTLGVLRVCKFIVPLMRNGGRIINISSGMGQLIEMESGSTAYRISKTALNTITKILSNELIDDNIKVNAICPGWVQTDMGGKNATLTVQESVQKITEFALRKNFPNGKFLRHGEVIPW